MAILNIRRLPDDVHARLRLRAAHNGRSMEAEARDILQHACDADSAGLTITLTPQQAEAAREYAHRHHTTPQNLVHQLLDRELADSHASRVAELFSLMDQAGGDLQGQTWTRDELYRV